MTPDVSLVMPARDVRADWLRAAALSALAEHETALELVVVDDASAEPVEVTLADLADERLRVVRTGHVGAYAARDVGIAASRGRVIRFVDADDVVVAGSTGHLLALTRGRDDVIAYGATVLCDPQLEPYGLISTTIQGDGVQACLLGRLELRVVSMAFPRAVVESAGPWDAGFEVSGDWDWVLRAIEHGALSGDERPAVRYRRHAASLTRTTDVAAGERARHRIIDRYCERHPEMKGSSLVFEARACAHVDRARAYAAAGDRRRAVDRLTLAAARRPGRALRALPAVARLLVTGAPGEALPAGESESA